LMGFVWCFCACLGCGFGKRSPAFKERFKVFPVLVVITCIATGCVFWFVLEPAAANRNTSIVGWGALGDFLGVCLGVAVQAKCAAASAQSPPTAAPTAAPQAAPEVVVAAPVVAGTAVAAAELEWVVVAGEAVVGQSVPSGSSGGGGSSDSSSSSSALTLKEMVDVLRRELGVKGENIPQLVDAACAELGLQPDGSLVERAKACVGLLHSQ